MLRHCINSAIINAGETPIGVTIMFDDDVMTYESLPVMPGVNKLLLTPRHYYVRAANILYANLKAQWPTAKYFAIIDDDIEFMGYPWADEVIKQFHHIFSDGLGLMDLYEYRSCCQIFSTFEFVDQKLGGYPYDWTYLQFYHDEELRHKLDDMNKFACPGTVNGQPVVIHKRDSVGGAINTLKTIKNVDYGIFEQRAKENGWNMYSAWVPKHVYNPRDIK